MSVQGGTVTLSSSTPVIIAGDGIHGVIHVTVRNRGTGAAYLGSTSVSTGSYQLSSADNPLQFRLYPGESLYGASTGTPVLDVLRLNDTT